MTTSSGYRGDQTGAVGNPRIPVPGKPFTKIVSITNVGYPYNQKYSTGYVPKNFITTYVWNQEGLDVVTGKKVVRQVTYKRPNLRHNIFPTSNWVYNIRNSGDPKTERIIDTYTEYIPVSHYAVDHYGAWKNKNGSTPTPPPGGGGGGGSGKKPEKPHDYSNELCYNFGMVQANYFRENAAISSHGGIPQKITNPRNTFNSKYGAKGVIAIYVHKGLGTSYDNLANTDLKNQKRYGFQFHYNPTTITMNYSGVLNVSPGYMASGADKFVVAGADSNASKISFDITLNRRSDFNYFNSDGTLAHGKTVSEVYGGAHGKTAAEIKAELKAIYTKGTMYDVEYLTNTLLGFKLTTELRGVTSDFGYISARPLELHLGKTFRYLGRIDAFSVQHAMFDERMVPILSTIHIEFSRFPDQVKKSSALA